MKLLVEFGYTGEGLRELVKGGASKRREIIGQLVKSLGGRVEAWYLAYGEYDGIAIVDGPDEVKGIAGLLALNAGGLVKTRTTVLIEPEKVDQAVKQIPSLPK